MIIKIVQKRIFFDIEKRVALQLISSTYSATRKVISESTLKIKHLAVLFETSPILKPTMKAVRYDF